MPSTATTSAAAPAEPTARRPFTTRWPEAFLQVEGASEHDLGRGLLVTLAPAAVISDTVDEEDAALLVRIDGAWDPEDDHEDVRDELAAWLADLLSGHTEDVEQAIRHRLTTLAGTWTAAAARLDATVEEADRQNKHVVRAAAADVAASLRRCIGDVERVLAVGSTR